MNDESRQKFLELFNKSKEFTEEVLRENERLRQRLGTLEEANKDYATRYTEIEEQNNNLASLYVASYQLHSTLDFREVIHIVQEILLNLVGAKSFAILLLDENTNELRSVACDGEDLVPGIENISTHLGEGILGGVARSGESFYLHDGKPSLDKPLAAVPLKIKDQVIGVIAIYKLLVQKHAFTAVDYELFALLAAHAATAIFSAKLFAQSERKLNTIQSFLDLLTTTS
ncbi:MAG TPA: GAF domain-containing protein [Thermoanaerobaculia bacterium]